MNVLTLVFLILPIIVFAVLDSYLPPRKSVPWTLGLSVFLAALAYFVFDIFDTMYLVEIGLLFVFGFVTLKFDKSRYFKLQPVAVGLITSGYFAYFQLEGTPVLVRLLPLQTKLIPEFAEFANNPEFVTMLSKLSFHMIFVFFFQSLLVLYTALRSKNIMWVLARLSIWPLIIIDAVIVRFF